MPKKKVGFNLMRSLLEAEEKKANDKENEMEEEKDEKKNGEEDNKDEKNGNGNGKDDKEKDDDEVKKESRISYLDSKVFIESDEDLRRAMKESIRNHVILSDNFTGEEVKKYLNELEENDFNDEQLSTFVESVIDPVMRTSGVLESSFDKPVVVSALIYELALAIQASKEGDFDTLRRLTRFSEAIFKGKTKGAKTFEQIEEQAEDDLINSKIKELARLIREEAKDYDETDMTGSNDLHPSVQNDGKEYEDYGYADAGNPSDHEGISDETDALVDDDPMVKADTPSNNDNNDKEEKGNTLSDRSEIIESLLAHTFRRWRVYDKRQAIGYINEAVEILKKNEVRNLVPDIIQLCEIRAHDIFQKGISLESFGDAPTSLAGRKLTRFAEHAWVSVYHWNKSGNPKSRITNFVLEGTVSMAASGVYNRYKKQNCEGKSGAEMKRCMVGAVDKAVSYIREQMRNCSTATDPERCKESFQGYINKWQEKKEKYAQATVKENAIFLNGVIQENVSPQSLFEQYAGKTCAGKKGETRKKCVAEAARKVIVALENTLRGCGSPECRKKIQSNINAWKKRITRK